MSGCEKCQQACQPESGSRWAELVRVLQVRLRLAEARVEPLQIENARLRSARDAKLAAMASGAPSEMDYRLEPEEMAP